MRSVAPRSSHNSLSRYFRYAYHDLSHNFETSYLTKISTLGCPYRPESTQLNEEALSIMVAHTCIIDKESVRLLSPRCTSDVDKSVSATESSSTVASVDSASSAENEGEPAHTQLRLRTKSVSFSTVEVREYDQVVGDHTDLIGPPLSIGWKYRKYLSMPLSEYEENKPPQRAQMEFLITPTGRRQILIKNWGYTSQELSDVEKNLAKRRESEEKGERRKMSIMRKVGKKVKRSFTTVADAVILSGNSLSTTPSIGGSPFGVVSYSGA